MINNYRNMKIKVKNLQDTKKLASKIASFCKKGDVILLNGTLGAGKTTFVQYFINSLLIKKEAEISSPTFNLVKSYETERFSINHLDLYRLKDSEELYELGIEDILHEGVSLVEWPELLEDFLDEDCNVLNVNIKLLEDCREFELLGQGDWVEKIEKIKKDS